MQVSCDNCEGVLTFAGDTPSFCAYCGHVLAPVSNVAVSPSASPRETLEETATEAPVALASEAVTLTPDAGPALESRQVPDVIGGYRLVRVLGSGGMGTVYEGTEVASGRSVALKLIGAEFAASTDQVERFRQEGRLASGIAHPRCLFVLAAEEEAGRPYIVMELMPGSTLKDLIDKKGPLPVEQAVAAIL